MNIQTLYIIAIYLVARNIIKKDDKTIAIVTSIKLFVFQLVFLLPLMQRGNYGVLILLLALYTIIDTLLVLSKKSNDIKRCAATIINIFIIILVSNSIYFDHSMSKVVADILEYIERTFAIQPVYARVLLSKTLLVIIGGILICFESNYLILAILSKYTQFQKLAAARVDQGDIQGMGRIIGYLERLIAYLLIITGNISAIAFVLAAKALARFKELEDKAFAEYFLIGTMASLSFTMILSFIIQYLLRTIR